MTLRSRLGQLQREVIIEKCCCKIRCIGMGLDIPDAPPPKPMMAAGKCGDCGQPIEPGSIRCIAFLPPEQTGGEV